MNLRINKDQESGWVVYSTRPRLSYNLATIGNDPDFREAYLQEVGGVAVTFCTPNMDIVL